jgi:hypothetical protein
LQTKIDGGLSAPGEQENRIPSAVPKSKVERRVRQAFCRQQQNHRRDPRIEDSGRQENLERELFTAAENLGCASTRKMKTEQNIRKQKNKNGVRAEN